jgi:hypothetical protein
LAAWLRQFVVDLEALAAFPRCPEDWRDQLHTLAQEVRMAADEVTGRPPSHGRARPDRTTRGR